MIPSFNINCDLGEGAPYDAALMALIQSCNIACGGHYGNKNSVVETIRLAKNHQVEVGAHPSYPDPQNFGRIAMNMAPKLLEKSLVDQITFFLEIALQEKVSMHHVKLHGALYNASVKNEEIALTIMEALKKIETTFKLYVPPRSILGQMAENHFEIVYEAFIDRTYQDNLELTPRSDARALITDPEKAYDQFNQMISKHEVSTINGKIVPIHATTFCIHGDTENSVEILRYIHKRQANVKS